MSIKLDAQGGLLALRAVAEQTRLRILFLLQAGELTVKDLTKVLGQSQPRISRHLKLLHEANLIERHREGSWVYFRIAEGAAGEVLGRGIFEAIDVQDVPFRLDLERLSSLVQERSAAAQAFFERNAGDWDRMRSLHVDEAEVEARLLEVFGDQRVDVLVDLGTGTGRMLELLYGRYARGIGVDANQSMLAYARTRLEAGFGPEVQVRQGDLYQLGLDDRVAEAVVMHLVLHHLSDPAGALAEAARILSASGRLFVVDFAPHDLEFLREDYAHQRLGFAEGQMTQWFEDAGLTAKCCHTLEPAGDDERKLAVSIWVAEKQAPIKATGVPAKNGQMLERIR